MMANSRESIEVPRGMDRRKRIGATSTNRNHLIFCKSSARPDDDNSQPGRGFHQFNLLLPLAVGRHSRVRYLCYRAGAIGVNGSETSEGAFGKGHRDGTARSTKFGGTSALDFWCPTRFFVV